MDPRQEKEQLLKAVPIEEDVLAKAIDCAKDTRRKVALGPSALASIMLGIMHTVFTRDPMFTTFAVKMAGDGNPLLVQNPDFMLDIGADQSVVAYIHEAYHLMLLHLYVDPSLNANQNWILACEATINWRIKKHLGLPLIQKDGKCIIVDPDDIYDKWRQAAKKANDEGHSIPIISKDEFYTTDMTTFGYLEMLPKPIKPPRGQGGCTHIDPNGQGQGQGQGGDGNDRPQLSQQEVKRFMEKVIQGAIQSAKNGRQGAKEEVLRWMDSSPEASQMWGDVGAGVLRGETTRSRKTDLWEKWTQDAIATKLEEGNKWRYNKKLAWDPRVTPKGRVPKKHGAVFVDTSGSMQQDVLDKVAALIGDMDDMTVDWHAFDGDIWPFGVGEGFRGGGGTSFAIIDEHVSDPDHRTGDHECCQEEPDFVLVITDGYAPEITPVDSDRWIWLITPGGSAWPQDRGMSCREIDLP
jgi:hypothetical protein